MQRNYTIMIVGLILLSGSHPVLAESQSDHIQHADTIAQFMDDQTFAVARLDVSRIDIDAIVKKVLECLPDESEENAVLREGTLAIYAAQETVRLWQQMFLNAGGKDIYGVYSMNDFPYFFLAVSLSPEADVPTLKNWLATVTKELDVGEIRYEKIGSVLIVGREETVERLKTVQTASRPEMTAAFAAAGDATVQLLLLPTQDQRRVIGEMAPNIPLPSGEVPSTTLTQGVNWMVLGVNLPPKMSLNIKLQSKDAASAQVCKHIVDQFYIRFGSEPEVTRVIPNIHTILELLTPELKADQLVLALSPEKTDRLIEEFAKPIVAAAREEARKSKCTCQLRSLGPALIMYADNHKGQFPPTLQTLVETEGVSPQLLVCPGTHDKPGQCSYIYRGADLNARSANEYMILAYGKKGNHKGYRHILFADGHVERRTEGSFPRAIQKDNELRKKNNLPEKPAD